MEKEWKLFFLSLELAVLTGQDRASDWARLVREATTQQLLPGLGEASFCLLRQKGAFSLHLQHRTSPQKNHTSQQPEGNTNAETDHQILRRRFLFREYKFLDKKVLEVAPDVKTKAVQELIQTSCWWCRKRNPQMVTKNPAGLTDID